MKWSKALHPHVATRLSRVTAASNVNDAAATRTPPRPLRTYDVFDTVVTRLVGLPTSAFLLVGQALAVKGLWRHSAAHFAAARVDAETRARINSNANETTLAAIYGELAFSHGFTEADIREAALEELRIEKALLRAVPSLLKRLQRERQVGCEIAFVSDMYLPAVEVRNTLRNVGVIQPDERLWVSSESGQTKSDGSLFELIAGETGRGKSDWVHTGDNAWSDVRMAQARGIGANAFDDCALTAVESVMESHSVATGGLSSLFAGAARWTRLALDSDASDDERGLNEFASQVAGPAVYAFVLWVLRRAHRDGIRRVWFMARDGEVMLPMARAIIQRLNLDIEVGYLYGGRQVVKIAALRAVDDAAVKWISGGAGILKLEDVLTRVGVEIDEVRDVAIECGLPLNSAIGWERMEKLGTFLRDPRVSSLVLAVAEARRADVLAYFRQCSIIDGDRCCVVDIGWRATVAKAIDELIGREQAARHLYLYFGLYARPVECDGLQMQGYLFDSLHGQSRGDGSRINALTSAMETFCQANHGSVMKLERVGDVFRPVCKEESAAQSSAWNVPFFQHLMVTFADSVAIDLCTDVDVDLRGLVRHVLQQGLDRPTLQQARLLAKVKFVDDQAGAAPEPLAHAYGFADLRAAFTMGAVPWYGLNWWTPGAWALTSPRMRFLTRVAAKLGRIRRRLQ